MRKDKKLDIFPSAFGVAEKKFVVAEQMNGDPDNGLDFLAVAHRAEFVRLRSLEDPHMTYLLERPLTKPWMHTIAVYRESPQTDNHERPDYLLNMVGEGIIPQPANTAAYPVKMDRETKRQLAAELLASTLVHFDTADGGL